MILHLGRAPGSQLQTRPPSDEQDFHGQARAPQRERASSIAPARGVGGWRIGRWQRGSPAA
jgi:hypothetical protein